MTRYLGKYFQPGVRFTTRARWVEKSGEIHVVHIVISLDDVTETHSLSNNFRVYILAKEP